MILPPNTALGTEDKTTEHLNEPSCHPHLAHTPGHCLSTSPSPILRQLSYPGMRCHPVHVTSCTGESHMCVRTHPALHPPTTLTLSRPAAATFLPMSGHTQHLDCSLVPLLYLPTGLEVSKARNCSLRLCHHSQCRGMGTPDVQGTGGMAPLCSTGTEAIESTHALEPRETTVADAQVVPREKTRLVGRGGVSASSIPTGTVTIRPSSLH